MAESEDASAAVPPISEEDGQKTRPPKIALKSPVRREDIPSLKSTVMLLKHDFSPRQRRCLDKNKVYKKMMENCGALGDKPRKLALCCSRHICPKEHIQMIACLRATRDASMCHEFRDEVERCGAKMSQRMLRVALADDWF